MCSYGSTLTLSHSTIEKVALAGGNGSAIHSILGVDSSLVVVNCSFSNCSARYGGAIYLLISGVPLLIDMSDVTFEGKGNSASKEGNTLYVVWHSTSTICSDQFRSFVEVSEEWSEETKVETWKGNTKPLREFVNVGERSGFGVCTQIKKEGNVGTVMVAVVDETVAEEEEVGGDGCVVRMEGGEVSGEVELGEVNGEVVKVNMGSELKKIMEECEDIQIVMTVSSDLMNG